MVGNQVDVAGKNGGDTVVQRLGPSFNHRRTGERMQHRLRDQSPVGKGGSSVG
jgi:hypothetical protein